MKSLIEVDVGLSEEAPRGGAGIEIGRWAASNCGGSEAPRGGAGIEIGRPVACGTLEEKPLVEGLVLKYSRRHRDGARPRSPSWRGWY